MITSISKTGKPRFLTVAVLLMVLFILPAASAHADWQEVEKLTASDAAAGDEFGQSVALSGSTAIVGSWHDDGAWPADDSGSAYLYDFSDPCSIIETKLTASDAAFRDDFGWSVALSGATALVGATGNGDAGGNSGSAYLYDFSDPCSIIETKLTASDAAVSDYFGYSVAISGSTALVGAPYDDDAGSSSGSAYLFDVATGSQIAKLTASDAAGLDFFGHSVALSGSTALVGAFGNSDAGTNSGSAYLYDFSDPCSITEIKLTASDAAVFDGFGWSVAISGSRALVGAYGDGGSSGSAYLFDVATGVQLFKLTASDAAADDWFGYSVALSGSTALVGARRNSDAGSYSGSAYLFNVATGSQIAKLTASDAEAFDHFGFSVALSGATALVGALFDDDACPGDVSCNSGSAYLFISSEIHGIKWHDTDGDCVQDTDEQAMQGWLIYIDENENGQFDAAEPSDITDADGNYVLIVSAGTYLVAEETRPCWEQTYPGGDGTYSVTLEAGEIATGYNFGNARPTEIHPSGWGQEEQDKLVATDAAAGDYFGGSVSISGDYAIVGAGQDDDNGINSGSAYIFAANDVNCSDWDQVAKLTAADAAAVDYFGSSVSISGDYAVIGASRDDDNGSNSGSAYIFYYDGASWSQQDKLLPADGNVANFFGDSVSISGDYVIVGAFYDDDYGTGSGSAYIFYYDGTSWSEQAKLLAADGAAGDVFGKSVSISGDYAIVGAYGDDDSGSGSGSAYIFKRDGTNWNQQAKLTASDAAAGDEFGYSVSISGDYAIIGADIDESAYIFERSGTNWNEQAKVVASDDGIGYQYFGISVSISGDYAVIGAFYDDDNGTHSGSAYIFKRDGTNWSELLKLLAADGAAGDEFGYSVSISGDYAIIGADINESAYMFGKGLCPSADLTGDCFVNFEDFAEWASQWLQGTP